jgi:hypothetical protein
MGIVLGLGALVYVLGYVWMGVHLCQRPMMDFDVDLGALFWPHTLYRMVAHGKYPGDP